VQIHTYHFQNDRIPAPADAVTIISGPTPLHLTQVVGYPNNLPARCFLPGL
jgi:hypothetical protein